MNETTNLVSTTFVGVLEEALTHYTDVEWLGRNSLLAAPYLLGEWAPASATEARHYGRALQALLQAAIDKVDGKYAERYRTILQEYYFHNRSLPVLYELVGLSRNAFNVNRQAAIAALAQTLITLLRPTLRLEMPPPPVALLERETLVQQATGALQQRQTVAILGTSGVGKTMLGAHLAQRLGRACFWYTIRSGLNDQVESFLFALGLFAWQQGAPALWLELVAGQGKIVPAKALALVQHGLAQIQPPPLLCIDEVDLLQPATNADNTPLVQLLATLRGQTPLLLIGQRALIDTDYHYVLKGLSSAAVQEVLLGAQIRLSSAEITQLQQLTQGNPRLVKLFVLAVQNGEQPADLLAHLQPTLAQTPALEFMLTRIFQRLHADEQRILVELSVFPSPAPPQPWQTPAWGYALGALLGKQLLQGDSRRGIEIPLLYRQLIYANLPVATVEQLHVQAAQLRMRTGAYTAALYHWLMARRPVEALTLWQEHHQQEIAQGQAATARQLLRTLPTVDLPPVLQEQHALLSAQLAYLVGELGEALADLRTLLHKTSLAALPANELAGMIANELSDFSQADNAFQRALRLSQSFVELRDVHIRKGMAWLHWRQVELTQAEQELNQAAYEVENMRGRLAEARNDYAAARTHYQQALELAETLRHSPSVAKTCTSLGGLLGLLGEAATAQHYLQRAYQWYQQTGNLLPMAGNRLNLAVAQLQIGEPQAALPTLRAAETLLMDRTQIPPRQYALLHQLYAEVYLALDELMTDQHHLQLALATEERETLPDLYRIYGELLGRQGDWSQAETLLRQSIDLAEQGHDQNTGGYGWRALAQLYAQQGRPQAATAAFAQALDHFTAMQLWHEVERTQQSMKLTTGL